MTSIPTTTGAVRSTSSPFNSANSAFGRLSTLLFLLLGMLALPAAAAQFGASAVVQKSPATITVSWDSPPWGVANYTVYRSTVIGGFAGGDGSWTMLATGLTGTSYVDSNVVPGTEYEYRIGRTGSQFDGDAYLDTGVELPMLDNRGKLILIVDNTYTTSLATEIGQLQSDLTGDGWTVIRHDVARTSTPASVKSLIQADYNADPSFVRAVFLLGRIPVIHSGSLAPDGHNSRPMPADGYYGDMNGDWSSSPSFLPSDVDLQVGRVDMYDMPSFLPLTDVDLTRQYLSKDHNFRHKVFSVAARQAEMTSDTGNSIQRQFFGLATPTNIPNLYYPSNGYYSPEFWNEVQNHDYLWFTKGTGGGQYNGCTGMGSTSAYAASPGVKTVFNTTFASWFVEWDVTDNFLRAPLAAKGYALCNVWSDLPAWVFMHMAMGKNIGFSTRVSQNNNSYYNIIGYVGLPATHRGVHIALMGDPTLRMHTVSPISGLSGAGGPSSVNLSWVASPDSALQGYAIYRAPSAAGPFTRLNASLVTGNSYTDAALSSGNYTYMVRAVKLEVSPSGSYQNPSQGTFKTVTVGSGGTVNQAPVVSAGNSQTITLPATATLSGTAVDDGLPTPSLLTSSWTKTSGPGTVTFANSAAPSTTASFSASGTYVLRLTTTDGALSSFNEVTVTVNPAKINNPPVANSQSITLSANAVRIITLTGSDPNNDPLIYSVLSNPLHGTLSGTAPNLSYTPAANYTGADSFLFTVNDGLVSAPTAAVSLTINAVTNTASADVVAVFHLDNTLADATGLHGNVTLTNNARLDASNLSWMTSPSGTALRFFDLGDQASISLPISDIYKAGVTTSVSVEAQIYINRYTSYSRGNANLLMLTKSWASQFIMAQGMWDPSARVVVGNQQVLISAANLSGALTAGRWHQVSMLLDGTGYTLKVDGNVVATLASTDLSLWNGTGSALLQFGDFDGWMDEVVVRSTGATVVTPPPTLPVVTVVTTVNASEVGPTTGAFSVVRSGGDLTQPLTVNFATGGTAQSRVNYQPLANSVTIPAGSTAANVSVTPILNGIFTGPLSLTLTLASSSNYQLGTPGATSMLIGDLERPKISLLGSSSLAGGGSTPATLQISVAATPGIAYLLQSSTDLVTWTITLTNQVGAPLGFV
ncbi:MAG: hypothetical protein JWR19_1791, partial [Pedosphaera sp.]|nr:hypothetical protein [Pedosphaera sp.]